MEVQKSLEDANEELNNLKVSQMSCPLERRVCCLPMQDCASPFYLSQESLTAEQQNVLTTRQKYERIHKRCQRLQQRVSFFTSTITEDNFMTTFTCNFVMPYDTHKKLMIFSYSFFLF